MSEDQYGVHTRNLYSEVPTRLSTLLTNKVTLAFD